MRYRWLFLAAGWFVMSFSVAGSPDAALDVIPAHQLTALSEHTQWRGLLGFSKRASHSTIKSEEFFLSPQGGRDPHQELLATLRAFASPRTDTTRHAVCRYPARYFWLAARVELNGVTTTPDDCPEFSEFSLNGTIASVSVIYATGYLGNPASYYGHLLIKLNRSEEDVNVRLDETAVNFGAIIPDGENMLVYIGKGILGGYSAGYTHREYFYHTHNYGENELRDLWEYRLSLSAEHRKLLVAHLWELIAREYPYYFFNRNCAFQIAQLLSVVTGDQYISEMRPWVLPQQVVQALVGSGHQEDSLVQSIRYLPSRQTRLYARYQQLNGEEKAVVKAAVSSELETLSDDLRALSTKSRQRTLDALMDYYQFRKAKGDVDQQEVFDRLHRKVLLSRYRLPPGGGGLSVERSDEPHQGRDPTYLSLGLAQGRSGATRYQLRLRPAYYDALDAEGESVRFSTLVMGEVSASFGDGQARLEKLTLVEVESIRRNVTGLPGDRGHSWNLYVGAEQRSPHCEDCLGFRGQGAAGYALPVGGDRAVLAGFVGGGYFSQTDTTTGWFVEPEVQLNLTLTERLTARARWSERHFYRGAVERLRSVEARLALSTNLDARLSYQRIDEARFGLTLGYYW